MFTQNSANRQPEKWFKRFLWLIAIVFACFLIGLGSLIVGDLPKAEPEKTWQDYADPQKYQPLQQQLQQYQQQSDKVSADIEKQQLTLEKYQTETKNAQARFENWLATRSVTEQSAQNPQVIAQTKAIDALKLKEQGVESQISDLQEKLWEIKEQEDAVEQQMSEIEADANELKAVDDRRIELHIFLYRLALTLPLLLLAVYLFLKQRHSRWWPFVWGFNFFAVFAFFVELVPYLPSYGGYVRYIVGIIFTIVIGRYAIIAMQRYIERKQAEEALPSNERQMQLEYDAVQKAFDKNICPSCERGLNFQNEHLDYCPHCGIQLFNYCQQCETRKNAFVHYCCRCGTASEQKT